MRHRPARRGRKHQALSLFPTSTSRMDLHLGGGAGSSSLQQQQYLLASSSSLTSSLLVTPPHLTPENVASVPPPGMSAPSQVVFAPQSSRYLAYIAVVSKQKQPPPTTTTTSPTKSSATNSNNNTSTLTSASTTLKNNTSSSRTAYYRPLTASSTNPASHNNNGNNNNGTSNNNNHNIVSTASTCMIPDLTSQSVSSHNPVERVLLCLDLERLNTIPPQPLLQWSRRQDHPGTHRTTTATNKRRAMDGSSSNNNNNIKNNNMEERLRRERQRNISGSSLTEFRWIRRKSSGHNNDTMGHETEDTANQLRLLIPARGSLYIQDGIDFTADSEEDGTIAADPQQQQQQPSQQQQQQQQTSTLVDIQCTCIHDKTATALSAMDAQLSPDGSMVAWTCDGELYVQSAAVLSTPNSSSSNKNDGNNNRNTTSDTTTPAVRISFGACQTESISISHGVADFVAQEEMDRYRGFWWHPDSNAILFVRNDESTVPLYRILHHNASSSSSSSHTPASPVSADASGHGDTSSHGLGTTHHHINNNNSSSGSSGNRTSSSSSSMYEDHRYPFAGKMNPAVKLGLVEIDRASILNHVAQAVSSRVPAAAAEIVESRDVSTDYDDHDPDHHHHHQDDDDDNDPPDPMQIVTANEVAEQNWADCQWLEAPREATEYLARVHWIPDGAAVVQWQDRTQKCTVLHRLDLRTSQRRQQLRNNSSNNNIRNVDNEVPVVDRRPGSGVGRTLLVERSDIWINLHHMFHCLDRPIHPSECCDSVEQTRLPIMPQPLPEGSFSFLFASERTGYAHLYLYTYCPGVNGEQAVLLRNVTSGNWIVESILGVDLDKDVVYFTGTYDSVLERHLYATPLLGVDNVHTWRRGASPVVVAAAAAELQPTSLLASGASSSSLALSRSEDSYSAATGAANAVTNSTGNANHINSHGRGVRRGLSKVMHALSGKGGKNSSHKPESRLHPVEIPLTLHSENRNDTTGVRPTRLTVESGMHSIVMDDHCRYFVDTCSDLGRPTTVKIYELPTDSRLNVKRILTLYDAVQDDKFMPTIKAMTNGKKSESTDLVKNLCPPELLSFPTSDGTATLHAVIYKPDPKIHGPGPYPLVCAVYGGPHVQRVNRSWAQSADMRAQRLRSLGFCVVKCDNRGSSRRGLVFESAIARRLGRLEVLDQVAAVRQLIVRGIADVNRVGVYGWSYGGYLAAMCLCRAPDVFHVAVAGAPVTSWDGYDTHYTERYMGLPSENAEGYRESAVFDHVPNMRGRLMIVHGLIDENVHFRHTTRLINKLIAAGKDYDLLIFPDERHSPRRLRDRIYMEQRISDYLVTHLMLNAPSPSALDLVLGGGSSSNNSNASGSLRAMAGHL